MLVQPPTTPQRVPGLVPGAPVYWLENREPAVLAVQRAAISAEWATIPADIRATFTAPRRDAMGHFNSFHLVAGRRDIAFDQFGQGYGRRAGNLDWAGLYAGGTTDSRLYYNHAATRTEYSNGAHSVVHEFGHHVDRTYNQIVLGYVDARRFDRLVDKPEFAALWTAAYPTIPSALYGRTNSAEWFAELWKYQIQNSPTSIYQLAGLDWNRGAAIRNVFKSYFPTLPPMSGPIF